MQGRLRSAESTPQHVDGWSADLRSVRGCVRSTLRNYPGAVRQFCDFLTNPAYGWAEECLRLFGTPPVQVVHDWNAAVLADETEGEPEGRAFTKPELEGPQGLAAGLPRRRPSGPAYGPGRSAVCGSRFCGVDGIEASHACCRARTVRQRHKRRPAHVVGPSVPGTGSVAASSSWIRR